ncbi:MAG: thioredoxin domain-containing protein, partial [Halorubrum sp.]
GSDLHRAAWRVADHEKVVAPNAHADDAPAPRSVPEGTAVVLAGDAASEPAATPAELSACVGDVLD